MAKSRMPEAATLNQVLSVRESDTRRRFTEALKKLPDEDAYFTYEDMARITGAAKRSLTRYCNEPEVLPFKAVIRCQTWWAHPKAIERAKRRVG